MQYLLMCQHAVCLANVSISGKISTREPVGWACLFIVRVRPSVINIPGILIFWDNI
uniref:Uncharacterized protein n=1 Tax=Arundo donax TaxID=35708 RepID=A0A0A9B530_ARUDO